jgi:8-oxo-dGDP phosphatase
MSAGGASGVLGADGVGGGGADGVDGGRAPIHPVEPGPEHEYRVIARQEPFSGAIFHVVTDEVTMPGGATARRDYTRHVGSAGVVALDAQGRVVLVRQYRHPVREFIWELPAGLLDVAGEAPLRAAQRELAEEADLTAARWDALVELHLSPGVSDEVIHIYLARDLSAVPDARQHRRRNEESELVVRLVDLDEAVTMALCGEITNASTVAGLLAAARARDEDWVPLRSADTSRG